MVVTSRPDVKNGFKSKAYEMSGVIDVYDPKFYDVELLIAKEQEWCGYVMRSYMEILKYCSNVATMDGFDDADEMEIKRHRDEAVKKYQDFLRRYHEKCATAARVSSASTSNASVTSLSTDASSENDEQAKKGAQVDFNIDAEKVQEGIKEIEKEIYHVNDWSNAESHQIEVAMESISKWKEKFSDLKEKLWTMRRNVKCFNLDATKFNETETALNVVENVMEDAIAKVKHEDKTRCLYSLSKSEFTPRKFPKFGGLFHEDFHKWLNEFKSAIISNRVRYEDQCSKLRECLSVSVLKLIPSTIENVDAAYTILQSIYGDPARVMSSRKANIASMGRYPESESISAASVRAKIEWLLNIELNIKDIFDISAMNDDMEREAFCVSTYKSVIGLFPTSVHIEVTKISGGVKEKMEAIYSYVVDKRNDLQKVLNNVDLHDVDKGGGKTTRAHGGQCDVYQPSRAEPTCDEMSLSLRCDENEMSPQSRICDGMPSVGVGGQCDEKFPFEEGGCHGTVCDGEPKCDWCLADDLWSG